MTYLVEKIDPRSAHPHLTDERYEVESVNSLGIRIEDLTPLSAAEADGAAELVSEGETFVWFDGVSETEVIARRA